MEHTQYLMLTEIMNRLERIEAKIDHLNQTLDEIMNTPTTQEKEEEYTQEDQEAEEEPNNITERTARIRSRKENE